MPNVTISLNLPTNGSPLQDIIVHPCVTSLDSAILTSSSIDTVDDSAFSGPYDWMLHSRWSSRVRRSPAAVSCEVEHGLDSVDHELSSHSSESFRRSVGVCLRDACWMSALAHMHV